MRDFYVKFKLIKPSLISGSVMRWDVHEAVAAAAMAVLTNQQGSSPTFIRQQAVRSVARAPFPPGDPAMTMDPRGARLSAGVHAPWRDPCTLARLGIPDATAFSAVK